MKMLTTMILFAVGAAAPEAASPAAQAQPAEKKICRTIQDPLWRSSRTKVCMTKAQWEVEDRETRDTLGRGSRGTGEPSRF
jgi:hypothetical protein